MNIYDFIMKDTLLAQVKITDALYESFVKLATLKHAPKNEIIARPDKINTKMMFLEAGIMRAYRLVEGQEYTHYFFIENWFSTDYRSYLTEQPSELYIETLSEVTYYEFEKKTLIDFFDRHHTFEKLGRIIAETAYLKMVERLVDFQTNDLKQRYHKLMSSHPRLFQQVPQKYIASYLGVAEQSLSRIKAIS